MSRRQEQEDKRGQEEAYARAMDLFDACRETKLEVDDNPTKVEVSHDGNRIYYGGETLGLLEYDNDGFIVPHGRIFKNKISDINPVARMANQPADSKFQNSRLGDVLVAEFNTWNVHLYDQNMQELGRLNSKLGANNRLPSTYSQFKTTSKQSDSCLWYSGTQNLSVVNTSNYVNNELNNFWMMQGRQVEPIGAHLSVKGDIVGIAKFDNNQHSLHYLSVRNTSTVLAYHRTDIFPYCHNWLCLDGSDRGDIFFIGGSSTMEQRGGTGYLIALTFDENVDVVRFREFPPTTGAFAIQVVKTYAENIILAATHNSIIALLWSNNNFLALKQIPTGLPLHDLVLSAPNVHIKAPVLYAMGTDGVLRAYNFGRPERGSKPVQMKPAKRNQKVVAMGEYLSVGQEPESTIIYTPANAERMSPVDRRKAKKIPAQNAQFYREFAIKQIMVPDGGLGRVQAYDNERGIFTGSNGLRVLENRSGDYILSSRPNSVAPFIELLLIPQTGELIVQERSTGDLVKYDASLKEASRLKAVAPPDARVGEFYNSVHFGSERKYLWNRGDGSLGLVNTATFNQDIVPNFFAKVGEQSQPVSVVSDGKTFNKIVGVYNTDQAQFVVFVSSTIGMFRKKSAEINPRIPFIYTVENCNMDTNCLELDLTQISQFELSNYDGFYMEQGIFFAGGGTGDMQNGSAIVQAVTFDQGLETIDELELKSGNGATRKAVTMLSRVPDRDVMFAAVFQAIFVIEWTGTHFCILNYVDELHTGIPISLCITNPSRFYTGASADKILNRIDFKPS